MKITLQLPPDLERQLLDSADRSQQTPEALILQTLRQYLPLFPDSTGWPQVVLDYAGDPEFPAFESARDGLSLLAMSYCRHVSRNCSDTSCHG